jgi:hypothetical protein
MFAGQVVDAPYANPFAAFVQHDSTLRVTYRELLSDVYATYENTECAFQMFTYKPFSSETAYVFVQFLKPSPARWFDLRVKREIEQFHEHQSRYMGHSFAMQLTEGGGQSKRPAAAIGLVEEEAHKRPRTKRLTANEKAVKSSLLLVMRAKSKETNVSEGLFANGEPCVELSSPTKQGSFDIALKFSVNMQGLIQVYFQKRDIYLFFEFSKLATCAECVRQVFGRII